MSVINWLLDGMLLHGDINDIIYRFVDSCIIDLIKLPVGAIIRFFVIIIQNYMNWELLYGAFHSVYIKGEFMDVIKYEYSRKVWILITEIVFVFFFLYRFYNRIPWEFVIGSDEDEPNPDDGPVTDADDDCYTTKSEERFEVNYRFIYSKRDYMHIALTYMDERNLKLHREKIYKKAFEEFKKKWPNKVDRDESDRLIKIQKRALQKKIIAFLPPWRQKFALYRLNFIPTLKNLCKRAFFKFVKKRNPDLHKWAMMKQGEHHAAFLASIPQLKREDRARKRAERARELAAERAFLKQYRKDMREFRIILAIEKWKNEQAFKQQQEWNRRFYGPPKEY